MNTIRCMQPKFRVWFENIKNKLKFLSRYFLLTFKKLISLLFPLKKTKQNIFCKYKIYGEEDDFKTENGKDTNNPDMNHEKLISYDVINSDVSL